MHQMSAAVGRVQLKHYNERMEEIQRSMNYFWDLLEGVPGIKAHRPIRTPEVPWEDGTIRKACIMRKNWGA